MNRVIKNSPFNLTDYKIFSQEINNLHWKDFEQFVISIFQKVFSNYEIQIKQTEFSHDGGKDGEGMLDIISDSNAEFSIQVKIWIEVKKRSNTVTGNDIGLHALTAFLNKVSLIIFASNKSFAPQAKETMKTLSNYHYINHDFVDGKRLFSLYQKYSLSNKRKDGNNNKEKLIIENHVKTNILYSKRPFKRFAKESIQIDINEPFYIFIDFDFTKSFFEPLNTYELYIENIQLIPFDTPLLINIIKLNGKITHTWVGYCKERILNPIIKIHFLESRIAGINIPSKINVQKPLFVFKSPPSIKLKINRINQLLTNWFNGGKYNSIIVYGNAGTGKSYLINKSRYLWLQNHVSEIILDGEIENSESTLLNRFFQDFFPIPIGLLTEEQENNVFNFLVDCRLPSKSARKLANSICSKGKIDAHEFSSDILSDLLYFLIKIKSEQRKTIIVFEDIHKCQPSVILLLIKTHRKLAYDDVRGVFMLLCSRKSASFKDQETLKEWLYNVEKILADQNIERIELEPYSFEEASTIIRDTIFSISSVEIQRIVNQIGTTPFALKEMMYYMLQKDWLEFDTSINHYLLKVLSLKGLKSAINSNLFTQVTKSRIQELKLRHPQWASTFLDSGACYGTSFNKRWCLETIGKTIDKSEIDNFLSISNMLGILKTSELHSDYLKFDHDLIRTALLQDSGAIRLRDLSSKLLNIIPNDSINDKQKAFLAFQAGIPEKVELFAERYGDNNVKKGIYEDALEAYKMTLYVVDKNMMSGIRNTNTSLWFIDEALNIVKENQVVLDLPINIRNQKLVSLCKKIIDTANQIGSGSQEIVSRFITEGLVLAKTLNDRQSQGIFHIRQGVNYFEKNNLNRSIVEYQIALKYLSMSDLHNQGHALVELAISLRHIGEFQQSFATLKKALKIAGKDDLEIKLRVFANAGGLYFNSNWKYTQRYWMKALKVAEQWGAVNYWTHMLIDIAHLYLLDDSFEEAKNYYQLAYEKAESSGLKSQEFRIRLHQSILALIEDEDYETQLLYSEAMLKQAESLGITFSIERKLWRVYANWANVAELQAKYLHQIDNDKVNRFWHLSYSFDKKVIGQFKEVLLNQENSELTRNRRVIPILTNVYLRSLDKNYPNPKILESLDNQVLEYIKWMSELILIKEFNKIPDNMIKFLKPLLGSYRFIFT